MYFANTYSFFLFFYRYMLTANRGYSAASIYIGEKKQNEYVLAKLIHTHPISAQQMQTSIKSNKPGVRGLMNQKGLWAQYSMSRSFLNTDLQQKCTLY